MTDTSQSQRAESLAIEARTLINQHLVDCARSSNAMATSIREMREDTAGSFRRVHERMDARASANNVTMVSVLIAAASGVLSIVLHFWK